MKGAIITHKGFEDIAEKEAKELIGVESEKREGAVIFNIKELENLCALAYRSQSAIKVLLLLSELEISDDFEQTKKELKKTISELNLSQWLDETTTFRTTCTRMGEHGFTSQDTATEIGAIIKDKTNKDFNYDTPDIIFHCQIEGKKGLLGIDMAGIELSKRDYRVFAHPAALKGTVAYCLARFSDYKRTTSMLDPFTKSGIIPIECALYATKKPANHYRKDSLASRHLKPLSEVDWETFFHKIDKETEDTPKKQIIGMDSSMPSITAAQKNAKLAGVNKCITFTRLDLEWLDTKYSEKEIDRLITSPPEESKRMDRKTTEKIYKELFYQADYILSEKGAMGFIARNTEFLKEKAESYKFKTAEERKVRLGKETFSLLRVTR